MLVLPINVENTENALSAHNTRELLQPSDRSGTFGFKEPATTQGSCLFCRLGFNPTGLQV